MPERAHPNGCERADHPRTARDLLGQLSAVLALATSLAGCTQGTPELEPSQGPPLRVVSTYPANGAGFDCSISDLECGVPIDATFEIRFDRYLLPSTAVRQSFYVYTGDPSNMVPPGDRLPALTPRYDVVERVVSYDLPTGVVLQPNTHYTAEFVVPTPENEFGFRAFDSVPLDETTELRLSFLTSNQPKAPVPSEPTGTCAEAVRAFGEHCASAGCHNATDRKMDLDLSGTNGVLDTAVGRVAHQAETGPQTGVALQNPARFGVGMPRIDPGRPDNSYLMYKLVTGPENYQAAAGDSDPCETSHLAPVDPEACVPAAPEENERLRAWFLRGLAMPRPAGGSAPRFLVKSELRHIESWILSGASCP